MLKICSRCRVEKDRSSFYKRNDRPSGIQSRCKKCMDEVHYEIVKRKPQATKRSNAKYYKNNRKSRDAYALAYYHANKDKIKNQRQPYVEKTRDSRREAGRKYHRANLKGHSARQAARRASKLQATPKWLTKEQLQEMRNFYLGRPEGYHVDHIVPLKGANVRGLHVPWNLQYLTASENLTKSNKLKGGY